MSKLMNRSMYNMYSDPEPDVLTEELVEVATATEKEPALILYNDDVNTFEHVIECLIKYCKHELLQAEQCAYIVHYKGKCAVKHGTHAKLKPIASALLDKGLSVEIE